MAVSYSDVTHEYIKNATPGKGSLTYDSDLQENKHKAEIEFAEWIHDTYGGDIHIKQEHSGHKNADYEWKGKLWDLKSPSSKTGIENDIKSGHKQIKSNLGGIMLNIKNNTISNDEIFSIIEKKAKWFKDDLGDIMVVRNGETIKVLRFKNKSCSQ